MIQAAKGVEKSENLGIQYFVGEAEKAVSVLKEHQQPLEYDLIVAVFVFNYVTKDKMLEIMKQAYQLLAPHGRFIFSIPHPSFPFWTRQSGSEHPFIFNLGPNEGYFDSTDKLFSGKIWRKDDVQLEVQLVHKPLQDYFSCIQESFGSQAPCPTVKELYADSELLKEYPAFLGSLNNIPLHMAFSVTKPDVSGLIVKKWEADMWPQSVDVRDHTVTITPDTAFEFCKLYKELKLQGINWENFEFSNSQGQPAIQNMNLLNALKTLGARLKTNLTKKGGSGFVVVEGTAIMDSLEDETEKLDAMRLFYYVLGSLTGNSVLTKRGRLYDVINRSLDIHQEDVLFSATNAASTYHTDSTDKFYFPDLVGLLCVHQNDTAESIKNDEGTLYITNVCNIYGKLVEKAPAELIEALQQPVIRDIIAKGMGNAEPKLQSMISDNKIPIFGPSSNPQASHALTFRYMRFWIEAGHRKTGVEISKQLEEAMNALDNLLEHDESVPRIRLRLRPGQVVFLNNHKIAHHRTAYQDPPGLPPRHMIRIWLGV